MFNKAKDFIDDPNRGIKKFVVYMLKSQGKNLNKRYYIDNYNFYKNLPGLNNEIYFGIRYGMSKFNNELLSFKVYDIDNNWNNESLVVNRKFNNLNAGWVELILGFNAEISKNIYMGISLRVNRLISQQIPSNYTNFFIPGFNKVTENNNFGTGITYNLIYQIPILKK